MRSVAYMQIHKIQTYRYMHIHFTVARYKFFTDNLFIEKHICFSYNKNYMPAWLKRVKNTLDETKNDKTKPNLLSLRHEVGL